MFRILLCLSVVCILLMATTASAGSLQQVEKVPVPVTTSADGINYLGPQPEPPDLPVQDKLDPFELFLRWLFDFGR